MPRIVEHSFYLLALAHLQRVNGHVSLRILLQLDSCCLNDVVKFVVQALCSVPLEILENIKAFEFMKPDHWTIRLVKRDQKLTFAA